MPCWVVVTFHEERLGSISFGAHPGGDNWCEETALATATMHDQWLDKALGKPDYVLIGGKPAADEPRTASVANAWATSSTGAGSSRPTIREACQESRKAKRCRGASLGT